MAKGRGETPGPRELMVMLTGRAFSFLPTPPGWTAVKGATWLVDFPVPAVTQV